MSTSYFMYSLSTWLVNTSNGNASSRVNAFSAPSPNPYAAFADCTCFASSPVFKSKICFFCHGLPFHPSLAHIAYFFAFFSCLRALRAARRSSGLGVGLVDCEMPPLSLASCRRACAHRCKLEKSKIPCLSSAKANALSPINDLSQTWKAPRKFTLMFFFSSRVRALESTFTFQIVR